MITMKRQTAIRTTMLTNRQRLLCLLATAAALLACSSWIYFHESDTSFLSFVSNCLDEGSPPHIRDRPSEPVVSHHIFDAELFHSDQATSTDQLQRFFMPVIVSAVPDSGVNFLKPLDCLPSVFSFLFLPGDRPSSTPKFGQRGLKKSGVLHRQSMVVGIKVLDTDVDTDFRADLLWNFYIAKIARKNSEPFVALSFKRNGLNFPFYQAVKTDFYSSDVLDSETVSDQPDAVPVRREENRVESVSGFKSWISSLLPPFDPLEEGIKSFIQTSKRSLTGREIGFRQIPIILSNFLEFVGLVVGVDSDSVRRPDGLPMFQGVVVKSSVSLKHDRKISGLRFCRIDSVLEGSPDFFYNFVSHDLILLIQGFSWLEASSRLYGFRPCFYLTYWGEDCQQEGRNSPSP